MGANPSTPEEPPPPPRGESPWQLPFLGALGHRPDPKPPVPELPDEIERMIHWYVMQEKDRERRYNERRVNDILEFRQQRLRMDSTKTWSLSDFCQLIDDKSFQDWLTNEYLKGKPEERGRLIDAAERVYLWYMNNKRGLSEGIREELRAKYEPVAEEKRNNGNKEFGVDRRQELLRMLEAMRYLCQESAIASTNEFDHRHRYKRPKDRYRFKF